MKVHHEQIKDQVAVIGSFLVEFDEDGNGIIEDEEYAEQLLNDGLGFSEVEEEKEKEKEHEEKTHKIVTRKAAKATI